MAATAPPKTILITLPAATVATSNQNFIPCQPATTSSKIGQKRTFSLIAQPQMTLVNKSPSPPSAWLPATVQGRQYKVETLDDDDDYEYGTISSEDQGQYGDPDHPPRKRERLTHLTAEEKMFRRKMKNRIAAQTARDRKKALMIDLEETVRRLEEENDTLAMENTKLRENQSSLADENERLKKMLSERDGRVGARVVDTVGPAESINVPLPKEQVKATNATTWLLASALIQIYSSYCAKSLSKEKQDKFTMELEELKENNSLTLEEVISRSPPEAIVTLESLIRRYKNSYTKPP